MKIVLILFFVAVCYALPTPDEWEDYKAKYNKSYSATEDKMRKELYLKSKDFVAQHNAKFQAGQVSWRAGINQFSDLTEEERKKPCLATGRD